MEILIASKNKGKIKEIKDYFLTFGASTLLKKIKLITFEETVDFPDVEEGDADFLENAILKAKKTAEATGKITLADDSGLCVDILGGIPGVISSRYAGENANDLQNRLKLLDEMAQFRKPSLRTARFVCQMVLWDPEEGLLNKSEGICEGRIGFTEKGSGGFGYDPIFIPQGSMLTMAEISPEDKNIISHRGKALMKMVYFLTAYVDSNS